MSYSHHNFDNNALMANSTANNNSNVSLSSENYYLVSTNNDPAPSLSVNLSNEISGDNNTDSENQNNAESSSNLTMSSSINRLSFDSSAEWTENLTPINNLMSKQLVNQFRHEVSTSPSTSDARRISISYDNPI